jgi:Ca-activated chloride channel family protein
VLLSDGEDHGGGLTAAAERLREEGVVVHALGVGTPAGAPLLLPGGGGRREPLPGDDGTAVKRDERGAVVISRLDEPALESIARATGGAYLRAGDAAADLAPVVRRIGAMATRAFDRETLNTHEERFQWPLGLAAAALFLHLAVGPFARRRREAAARPPAAARATATAPGAAGRAVAGGAR